MSCHILPKKIEEIEEAPREVRDHLPNAWFFRLSDISYLDKAEITSNSTRINPSEYIYEDFWVIVLGMKHQIN